MKTISMLEFRKNAGKIIRWSQQGQRMTVTYRGKPVMILEPVPAQTISDTDPFYSLGEVADKAGGSLTNKAIDEILYGS
jgi:antitoxin (DNA-binding transcriptional repressor) of toxin-antitoxin stability system